MLKKVWRHQPVTGEQLQAVESGLLKRRSQREIIKVAVPSSLEVKIRSLLSGDHAENRKELEKTHRAD